MTAVRNSNVNYELVTKIVTRAIRKAAYQCYEEMAYPRLDHTPTFIYAGQQTKGKEVIESQAEIYRQKELAWARQKIARQRSARKRTQSGS